MVIESWNHGISQGFMGFNYGLADFMGVKNLDLIYIYILIKGGWLRNPLASHGGFTLPAYSHDQL